MPINEKLVTVKTCRRAEPVDYILYYGADLGEMIPQNVSEAEEAKPYNQRSFGALFLLELGKLGCNLIKFGVNHDTCNPIGSR